MHIIIMSLEEQIRICVAEFKPAILIFQLNLIILAREHGAIYLICLASTTVDKMLVLDIRSKRGQDAKKQK